MEKIKRVSEGIHKHDGEGGRGGTRRDGETQEKEIQDQVFILTG